MALLAINAADQTILRMYAKMANSVVSGRKVHVLDQSEQEQSESGDDESDYLFVGALYVGAVAEQRTVTRTNGTIPFRLETNKYAVNSIQGPKLTYCQRVS